MQEKNVSQSKDFLVGLIESLSVGVFFLIFAVAQISQFFQSTFINLSVYGPIYIFSAIGLIFHTMSFMLPKSFRQKNYWLAFLILLNTFLASGLIFFSGLNQSIFFFLYLLNIVVASMFFQMRGALLTAIGSSAIYNIIMIFGPEIKAGTFLFLAALNNLAFFVVAALAGYLSEQMESLGAQLVQTEKKLSEFTQLASVIIEKMPIPLFTIDSRGVLIRTNEVGNKFLDLNETKENLFLKIFPFSAEGEHRWRKSEDLTLDVIVRKGRLKVEGVEEGEVYLVEDVTRQRQLEFRLRQQEKMAAIGQLAAGIAHEIRNPLAGISGSVQMLSSHATTDDDKKLFKIIMKETDRLNNLITEFLDYSRPMETPETVIDIIPLVNECIDLVKFNKKLRQDLEWSLQLAPKLLIRGSKDKLKQAFLNIIINGVQAMQDIEKPKIQISAQRLENRVVLKIQDFGCGMPEKIKKRMFEPFLTTKVGGTGLGLAVTHKILEGHSCELVVESIEKHGTTFSLSFVEVLSS